MVLRVKPSLQTPHTNEHVCARSNCRVHPCMHPSLCIEICKHNYSGSYKRSYRLYFMFRADDVFSSCCGLWLMQHGTVLMNNAAKVFDQHKEAFWGH